MDWIDKLNKELEERRERNKTPEAREEGKKRIRVYAASVAGVESGKLNKGKFINEYSKNNPEVRSKAGIKGGNKNVESGHIFTLHEKYLEKNKKFLDHTEHTCPHCNKVVNGGVYHRWHGDNCKELQKIEEQLNIIKDLPKTFTSNDVVRICKEKEYNNKKIKYGICKNPKYIEVIYTGTNQTNPSIFKKVY